LTIDETLFTLQFAVRVRNISLGSAKRQVNTKNLEEALRVLKAEMKETKKRRMQLEETVQEVKRENKRLIDKAATITENKQRATEDAKSKVDGQIQQLVRTNEEMKSRITEEKEAKQQAVQELDLVQKTLKKTQDQMKEINKDKDKILYQLKQKDKDYEALKLLHHQQMQKMEKQIADKIVAPSHAEAFSSSTFRKKSMAATITPSFGALSSSSIDTVESNIGDQNSALNNSITSLSTSTHRSPEKSLEGSLLRPPSRITSTMSSRLSSSSGTVGGAGTTAAGSSERALGLKPPARVGIPRPSTGPALEGTDKEITGGGTATVSTSALRRPLTTATSGLLRPRAAGSIGMSSSSAFSDNAPATYAPLMSTNSPLKSAIVMVAMNTSSAIAESDSSAAASTGQTATSTATSGASLRSSIAVRSKEALLRHQERMKQRKEKL